jgi:hypothetical protein
MVCNFRVYLNPSKNYDRNGNSSDGHLSSLPEEVSGMFAPFPGLGRLGGHPPLVGLEPKRRALLGEAESAASACLEGLLTHNNKMV